MQPAFAGDLAKGAARAAILWPGADWQALGLAAAILAPRARYVLAGIGRVFDRPPEIAPGIHPTAVIDPTAESARAPPSAPSWSIGARVAHRRARADPQPCLDRRGRRDRRRRADPEGARIGARVRIGDRFVAQPGAVIGGDGFSFVTPTPGHRRGGARHRCGQRRAAGLRPDQLARRGPDRRRRRGRRQHLHRPRHRRRHHDRRRHQDRQPRPARPQREGRPRPA